jgi:hypothetical protein
MSQNPVTGIPGSGTFLLLPIALIGRYCGVIAQVCHIQAFYNHETKHPYSECTGMRKIPQDEELL